MTEEEHGVVDVTEPEYNPASQARAVAAAADAEYVRQVTSAILVSLDDLAVYVRSTEPSAARQTIDAFLRSDPDCLLVDLVADPDRLLLAVAAAAAVE